MRLRREVPVRLRRIDGHEVLFRLWLAMISAFTTLVFLSVFGLVISGCGRGGAAPCVPQPALHGTGAGQGGPQCGVRR